MFLTSIKRGLSKQANRVRIGDASHMPHLYRACTDFGFAVVALCRSSATPKAYALCDVGLMPQAQEAPQYITPEFDSLMELEAHMATHTIDIVQRYLFGDLAEGDTSFAAA